MRCSLFGKLPAKRDFIALFSPRVFLDVWEPWLQASISASRQNLGEDWQEAFLTAPIWRFWLGADICRTPLAGALMSSMDGVGRYHPLTIFAVADPGAPIPPPDIDAQDAWFAKAEDFLLSTLDKDTAYDTITAALDQLPPPASQAGEALADGLLALREGTVASPAVGREFVDVLAELRRANHVNIYAAASFWWTLGGGDYAPHALCCHGLPDPFLFSTMLTGRFSPATEPDRPSG
jgi:type VI secretion system protein ImpM